MSEKIQKSLSSFMKKQIDEKSSKKIVEQKSSESKEEKSSQEITEGEKQKLAREEFREEIADQDQEAIRKLILKNIVYYTAIITVLVIFAIGVIKIAPALLSFLNGLIYKLFIGSLKQ